MGFEAFRAIAVPDKIHISQLHKTLNRAPFRHLSSDSPGWDYFEYRDSSHIIELELDPDGELSFRFALCQPGTVDQALLEMISALGSQSSALIKLIGQPPGSDTATEFLPPYNGLQSALFNAIKTRRDRWQAAFGSTTAVLTCAEAVERFMLGSEH
ncbi:hypothetical protein [Pyxidicoccus sp. MSG2]|uniref:hypothetical protein n=1 Tax=Pyxidicoccus sp. MSG2 TaxID=2996790 RepID=UPI00226FCB30|nr:hypothetical protein [Pyxidicoccus sp. MSG2]MCY1020498.1 hypothetical protein [Pyxidicoccus sp. MSG2]